MIVDDYLKVLDRCGGRQQNLERRERWRLLQGWRECYAADLHEATRRWKLGQYEWHIFSYEHAAALNGREAFDAYHEERSENFLVCPERAMLPAVRMVGSLLPDLRPIGEDVYVWPDDLSWSMAFTHEESIGLGPYFCLKEWVALNPKSLAGRPLLGARRTRGHPRRRS